jgi:hypothetical protein
MLAAGLRDALRTLDGPYIEAFLAARCSDPDLLPDWYLARNQIARTWPCRRFG